MSPASIRQTAILSATLLLWTAVALAQGNGTSTLTGTVIDSSGAMVPGVKVQLILESTATTRTTTTNTGGFFSFSGVPAGTYSLKAEAQGFAAFLQNGVVLHINDQIDLKQIVLKVAGSMATVEVSGAAPEIIPVSSGDVSYTITAKQIDNLAIIGRNAIELVKILPGAQNSGGWNGTYTGETSAFNQGAGAYTVNGTRFDQMAVVSDGGNVIDHGFNGGAMVTPNFEMIQEAKVETASFSAENPNGPIVMETVTKSGGKNFHGAAYYNIRDGSMNSNDWLNGSQGVAKPASRFQYPGFNIGGPVIIPGTSFNKNRDKLFFFAGFEWMRQSVDLGLHQTIVPTAAMRTGDFSDLAYLSSLRQDSIVHNKPCDASKGTLDSYCAGDGIISPTAIDPGGQVLMNLYPLPNVDPATHHGYNYLTDLVNPQPRAQQLVKIDFTPTMNTHFSGRYNHEGETIPFPYGLWQTWPQNQYPGGVVGSNNSHSLALNFTHVFSPTLTNELTATFNHLWYGNQLTTPDKVSASKLGYPYQPVYSNGFDVIPNVGGDTTATGVANFFNEGGVIPNQNTPKWTYTLSENISKAIGSHLLKGGFYWSRVTWQQRTGDNSYLDQGAITLASWNTLTGFNDSTQTNAYADLVMGHISMFSQGLKSVLLNFAGNEYDFYALDDWKLSRRLTVNFGARVDHIGWWYNKEGNIAIFDPAKYDATAPISAFTGIQTHSNDSSVPLSGYKPVGLQFAPSVGFSWDVTGSGKTVVRGGFGMNFFRDEGISAGFKLVQNPPLQSMDYFSPWPGLFLSQLSTIVPSASAPWLNVAVANDSKMPRTYSYNLTVQREIPGSTLVSLAYVGNQSTDLVGWRNTNPVPLGSETGQDWPGQWMDQPYRQFQNIAGIYPAGHILKSNYNSFQMTARRGKGMINYWLSYTLSKGLGQNSADAFDLNRAYGPLPWDRTHALKIAYNISLPSVSKNHLGNHAVMNGILDGWQVSGITEFDSGAPLLPSLANSAFPGGYSIGLTGTGNASGVHNLEGRYIVGTPDEAAVPKLVCDPTANLSAHQVFNGACFQSPTVGNNGDYRIPYIHGPLFTNSDLSVFKNFKISESKSLQFRAEAFNFLNHPLWGFTNFDPYSGFRGNDPGLNLVYSDFGVAPDNAATAGVMTSKFGHRTMQLAVKFYF